ncbi:MAG: CinA family nicotinamide mononucleotide deamidase-related protein [Bacteroidota bacterium]
MLAISFITIGTELLKGTIINTNAAKAGTMLKEAGYPLHRVVTISDEKQAIQSAVAEELRHSEVVLVSGGLGPTNDDITKITLAEYFGSPELALDTATLAHLKQRYQKHGRALNELTYQQAMIPTHAEVVRNSEGTAPGLLFRKDEKILIAMPGVPFEMLTMLAEEVIPLLKAEKPGQAFFQSFIRLAGVPESEAAQRMARIETKLPPQLGVAYLPRVDGLWLELSIRQPISLAEQAKQELSHWTEEVYQLFTAETYARSQEPLPQILLEAFTERKLTLAVAESMTGGRVSAHLVSVSGASTYYKGGVTAYFTQVKTDVLGVPEELIETEGVVSSLVAEAMAQGVREKLGADVGLAITGYAEPPDAETQAHAWLGYADAQGSVSESIPFIYRRQVNIDRAAHKLMLLGLRKVKERY